MNEDEINNVSNLMSNENFLNPSIIETRLNAEPVLTKIESYLSGVEYIEAIEDGEPKIISNQRFSPKANDEGISQIMAFLSSKVNPQVAQGNFAMDNSGYSEKYELYIDQAHKSFTDLILINVQKWDMDENDLSSIIDTIMQLITPFMSRLIGNKERESYGQTLRTTESNTMRENSNGFGLFKKS